ncbi:MAG TPA: SH3 domain-containing protein [Myxococcaceae bacterium]|jgi:hypothetical protein
MRITGKKRVALLAVFTASLAFAQKPAEKPKGTLYVKARNTRLMASASPTADAIAILQPGQQVDWLGADPKNGQWHQVVFGKKKGVVFQSNLSKQPPRMELVAQDGSTQPKDPVAFANSGAAVKGLAKGAIDYGQAKGTKFDDASKQLQALEVLAETITPDQLAAHARGAGLFPVVGPRETTASRGGK